MIRRVLVAVCASTLWAASAGAVDPGVTIQPDEIFPWACDFHVPVSFIVGGAATVTAIQGTDASAGSLISGIQVSPSTPSLVTWILAPAGKTSGTIYQVHVLVEDVSASRFACDGKVTVRATVLRK